VQHPACPTLAARDARRRSTNRCETYNFARFSETARKPEFSFVYLLSQRIADALRSTMGEKRECYYSTNRSLYVVTSSKEEHQGAITGRAKQWVVVAIVASKRQLGPQSYATTISHPPYSHFTMLLSIPSPLDSLSPTDEPESTQVEVSYDEILVFSAENANVQSVMAVPDDDSTEPTSTNRGGHRSRLEEDESDFGNRSRNRGRRNRRRTKQHSQGVSAMAAGESTDQLQEQTANLSSANSTFTRASSPGTTTASTSNRMADSMRPLSPIRRIRSSAFDGSERRTRSLTATSQSTLRSSRPQPFSSSMEPIEETDAPACLGHQSWNARHRRDVSCPPALLGKEALSSLFNNHQLPVGTTLPSGKSGQHQLQKHHRSFSLSTGGTTGNSTKPNFVAAMAASSNRPSATSNRLQSMRWRNKTKVLPAAC